MATYREAWGLFQDEPEVPLNRTNHSSIGSGTGADRSSTTPSNAQLLSELRRLRQDLQELQSARNNPSPNLNRIPQTSDRTPPFDGTPSTQADNPPTHQDLGPQKSEIYRCWESCCKGRIFSNRSNLIRHQRERKGESAKLRCSFCDAVFLRSSARNAHEAARRCRR
ncbi:hypothetical protein BJY01DRAFT_185870 [Aspergillus pseudoustus]|uniref:C2H2-type domain-containing protein n=1 Tax=Aspergillus pseudoustus TaxID=1810923 RepID=A0ABR4K0I3_9EURO